MRNSNVRKQPASHSFAMVASNKQNEKVIISEIFNICTLINILNEGNTLSLILRLYQTIEVKEAF